VISSNGIRTKHNSAMKSMKQNTNTEAAETDQTTDSPAVVQQRLVLPPVLDACCSTKAFWFNKENPDALFMDKRDEEYPIKPDKSHPARNLVVAPDVVGDFTKMPFPDESFWHVVFDPPHARFGENSVMAKTYGTLGGIDWREMLRDGFSECFRVLKPNGTLIFKWCEWDIPTREVLKMTDETPLYGHISGKRAQTHWIAFLKQNARITGVVKRSPR